MKTQLLFFVLLISVCRISAQGVAINAAGTPADASAILDLSSADKGLLVPRMTTSERNSIQNPAQGLLVFDTDARSFWFYSNGWIEMIAGGLVGPASGDLTGSYPYPTVVKIQNRDVSPEAPGDLQIMKWDNAQNQWKSRNDSLFLPYIATASDDGPLIGVINSNTTQGSSAIYGRLGDGSDLNPSATMGVWGDNFDGLGVLGTSDSGIGVYGLSHSNHGVYGYSTSAGWAGVKGSHANAGGIGVMGEVQVSGTAILGQSTGTSGKAAAFLSNNTGHSDTTIVVSSAGVGMLSSFSINNSNNSNHAVRIKHAGTGTGLKLLMSNPAANATGIDVSVAGTGIAATFSATNTTNEAATLWTTMAGKGSSAVFNKDNTTGSINDPHLAAVIINNNSKGSALNIQSLHSPSLNSALYINYGGQAYGIDITGSGKGIRAATPGEHVAFMQNTGGGKAIEALAQGAGVPAILGSNNASSGIGVSGSSSASQGIGVLGTGSENSVSGVGVKGTSGSSASYLGSVTGINSSTGIAVYGEAQNGTGVRGVSGTIDGAGVMGVNTVGHGVVGSTQGQSSAGVNGIADDDTGFSFGVLANNLGKGDGIRAFGGEGGSGIAAYDNSTTGGRAAYFSVSLPTNNSNVVHVHNSGLGTALYVATANASNASTMAIYHKNGTGNFAIYRDASFNNKIRFDNTGKGFFNGGTQTSGADIAEAFDVESNIMEYTPGDVLVISQTSARTVTKSTEPYSTLVAGVYATKPGVLMTEEEIDADLSGKVPMGVIGVIPTKVCLEGGPIRMGDLLVTSSTPGVAMKADIDIVMPGQVLGKALDNFDGNDTSPIRVLVNVH